MAGEFSLVALQPHPAVAPFSFHSMVLLKSVSFLGWSCSSAGLCEPWGCQSHTDMGLEPPFQSLFALMGWRSMCSKIILKINKNKTQKKDQVWGEKELLCSLKLPSLELVGGAVPKEVEGEHQGGVQLVLSGPQECL